MCKQCNSALCLSFRSSKLMFSNAFFLGGGGCYLCKINFICSHALTWCGPLFVDSKVITYMFERLSKMYFTPILHWYESCWAQTFDIATTIRRQCLLTYLLVFFFWKNIYNTTNKTPWGAKVNISQGITHYWDLYSCVSSSTTIKFRLLIIFFESFIHINSFRVTEWLDSTSAVYSWSLPTRQQVGYNVDRLPGVTYRRANTER